MVSRPVAPSRDAYGAFTTLTTRWFDNDAYAHMNNAVHYQLFDTVVNGHLMANGLLNPATSPAIFLVVDSGCSYFSQISFPDVVTAGLRVAHLGTSSVRYEVGLFRAEEPCAAAAGHFAHVHVDRATRRPVPMDAAARDVLARLRMS